MRLTREKFDSLIQDLEHYPLDCEVFIRKEDLETLKAVKRAIKTIEQVMDERRIYVEQLEQRNSELEHLVHHYRIILNGHFGKPRNCTKCEYNDTDSIIVNRLEQLEKENKELKESHDYIYEAYQDAGKKMFDYQEQLENSIPKSVIREKIEELRYKRDKTEIAYYLDAQIDILKELLGGDSID